MKQSTSDLVRKIMRLVVTEGVGKSAKVPGYYVGGKTGTAQKVSGGHGYKRNARVAAFVCAFPMNAPRYIVYMMLDEPKPNAKSHGYATAGWVAAPAAAKVIARVAPMLGLLPDTDHAAEINAELALPLEPARPANAPRMPAAEPVARVMPRGPRMPTGTLRAPAVPTLHDLRREARYLAPDHAAR